MIFDNIAAQRRLFDRFPIGCPVYASGPSPIHDADAVGIVYAHRDSEGRPSVGVIYESGGYDGYSPDDLIRLGVVPLGLPFGDQQAVNGYKHQSVPTLCLDFQRGMFNAALQRARLLVAPCPAVVH